MSNATPRYSIFIVALSQTGELPIGNGLGVGGADTGQMRVLGKYNYLRLVNSTDTNGNFFPGVFVNVIVGRDRIDPIPFRINGLVRGDTEQYTFQWTVQPAGYTAVFLASQVGADEPNGIEVEAPPSTQIISSATGTQFVTAQINAGTVATLLLAGSTTRQQGNIRNLDGSKTLYLGGPAVTTANGFPVFPGETFDVSGTTAPIYGIVASGTIAVATELEA